MKKIILTGGGTAGHVTPNLALIPELKKKGYEIYYIGSKNGMERELLEREKGVIYYHIKAGKLRRYFDIKNFTDIFKILVGFIQSIFIIRKIKPAIIFSKGGFVSCPVVWGGWINRVPVVIHESDMTPGLANKLSIPFATKVCYAFPETGKFIKNSKGLNTGIPIRKSLFEGNKNKGIKLCNFKGDKPIILVFGGSQGSKNINSIIRTLLKEILKRFELCHICGKGNIDEKLIGVDGYCQFEYVNEEMNHLLNMADIVISRAGATSIFEILALRKPNILIPLTKAASRGDQLLNAESFEKQGFSKVLSEDEAIKDPEILLGVLDEVYSKKDEYIKAMESSKFSNGIDIILEIFESFVK